MMPMLPVMMENCAEVTYPISEDMSMGVMFAGSNLLALAFIFALQVQYSTHNMLRIFDG